MCYDSVTNYGTPSDPWATRFAAAEAASDNLCVPPGTYDIGSNLTLTKNWQILDGAHIKPASGITVTFAGTLNAARYRIFDLSAGGTIALQEGSTDGLPPQWWNDASDTDAIQGALNAAAASGIPVDLGPLSYSITATLQIAGDVEVVGGEGGAVIATSAKNHYLFTTATGADNVSISRVRAAGERGLLQIGASFDAITVTECDFEGVADVITNYFVYCAPAAGYTGGALRVSGNDLRQCTAIYTDGLAVADLFFDDNEVTDGTRFLVRARSTVETGPDEGNGPTRVWFRRNRIFGINTGLSDLSNHVARVLQTSAAETITMTDNHIERLVTDDTGTVVYWGWGSLEFGRNFVRHVESLTTGDRVISDKSGPASDPARYSHKCYENTFDQTTVSLEKTPSAVYHIYALQNFVSDGDTFIGCRCPTHRVWHSVASDTQVPQNIVFQNATVLDHKYPAVVELVQFQKNVVAQGFTVHRLSNPDELSSIGGETRLMFANVYASFDEEVPDIENLCIRDNTILEADDTFVFASIRRHPVSEFSEIRNVVVHGNVANQGDAFCHFSASVSRPLGRITVTDNVAPVASITLGTTPPMLILGGNTPSAVGSTSWNPGTIAATSSVTTTVSVAGAGARSTDAAEVVTDPALQAGLQISAAVTAANTVTLTLNNPTASPITQGTFDALARVTFR